MRLRKIGGEWVNIRTPHEFNIETYEVTEGERSTAGVQHLELITVLRKFTFYYKLLRDSELRAIQSVIDVQTSNDLFFDLEYPDGVSDVIVRVYKGALDRRLLKNNGNKSIWSDVSFSCIEQGGDGI